METPHSELRAPNSPASCAAFKADGQPCHARPIPGSDYCPFHHPDHASAFAEGRSQGGAAPRRRVRRLPLILDHLHIAEFLSELMVEVMNSPADADLRRLQALTQAARVHLKAVGAPKGSFFFHFDRRDTPPHLPHLRRYDPPAAEPDPSSDPSDRPDPSDPGVPAEEPVPSGRPPEHEELLGPALRTLQLYAPEENTKQPIHWLEPDSSVDAAPWKQPSPVPVPASPPPAAAATARPSSSVHPLLEAEPEPCLNEGEPPAAPGQSSQASLSHALDKRWTSAPATIAEAAGDDPDRSEEHGADLGAPLPPPEANQPAPLKTEPGPPPADEPAPPPRRPCIVLTTRPAPGSVRPWSEPTLLPWEGRHGREGP